jgi:DNA-binding CsgD family transcriptional regulator
VALEAAAVAAGSGDVEAAQRMADRVARLREYARAHPDAPATVFAALAIVGAHANEPAERVSELALRALAPPAAEARGLGWVTNLIATFSALLFRRAIGHSQSTLELARALTDLGATLRRRGKRAEARGHLRRALDLAQRCRGEAIAEHARAELLATGARPCKVLLSGPESLTASERRVAEMAARGRTNREIAQALFVTQRTVETHLTHVFQKLGIESRTGLVEALETTAG